MTEPTEAQIKEACDLLNAGGPRSLWDASFHKDTPSVRTVAHLIAQREAAMQRVSDAFTAIDEIASRVNGYANAREGIQRIAATFILPDPTPTPEQVLAAAVDDAWVKLPPEWTREAFVKSVTNSILTATVKRGHHVAPIKEEG